MKPKNTPVDPTSPTVIELLDARDKLLRDLGVAVAEFERRFGIHVRSVIYSRPTADDRRRLEMDTAI